MVKKFLTPEEKKAKFAEALLIAGKEQTEAGRKFCYGCGVAGHICKDCKTNPWEGKKEQNTNKKRTRQSHSGETPEGKVAKFTRVFAKPECGPEQMKLILFPMDGEVTEERFQTFK